MLKVVLKLFLKNIVSISAFGCAAVVLLAAFDPQVAANSSHANNEYTINNSQSDGIDKKPQAIVNR